MCFKYEFDETWTADLVIEESRTAESPENCSECGRLIDRGDSYEFYYAMESEECLICERDWSERYDEEVDPETCDHDYGNEETFRTCSLCKSLIKAIESVELKEGCDIAVATPPKGMLYEAVESGHGWTGYAEMAKRHEMTKEADLFLAEHARRQREQGEGDDDEEGEGT